MKSFYSSEQIVKGVNRAKILFVPTDEETAALDAELGSGSGPVSGR